MSIFEFWFSISSNEIKKSLSWPIFNSFIIAQKVCKAKLKILDFLRKTGQGEALSPQKFCMGKWAS